MPGEPYLSYPLSEISSFLGANTKRALFIPFAAVTFSFDEYERKVKERFEQLGHELQSIHHFDNYKEAILQAEVIVIGGGNTWQLLRMLQDYELVEAIRHKVQVENIPYIGWSAGSNVACPSIKTTNDMPIVAPLSFEALNFIPFQINPHYLDKKPEGHGGESREDRINEFIEVNPEVAVVGLREGSILHVTDGEIKLLGDKSCRIFRYNKETTEVNDLSGVNLA